MTGKHTPGPWGDPDKTVVVRGISWMGFANYESDEARANAALIAAAPEMLEALKRSARGWENAIELGLIPPQHITSATILKDGALSAIAKAEGGE